MKETKEYVEQERARLDDYESALKFQETTLEEQKMELVSFLTSSHSGRVIFSQLLSS